MSKLSERDICTKRIIPALENAGWDIDTQVREEVSFTDGRINVKGTKTARGKRKRADFILYYKPNIPIAIIEAKDNNHNVGDGMQQALEYSRILDIPSVFSSNGDGFIFHDKTNSEGKIEIEVSNNDFPSPEKLWKIYQKYKEVEFVDNPKIVSQDYFADGTGRSPRYYQQIAINRTVEAIAKGENRILLVMATGTGKTYTAFQFIYRLWKSGSKKRILFLADRTALISQTSRGDFRHFKEAMTTIRQKRIDKAYNIYLALYQGLSDSNTEDAYKQFSPDFFDLVVVDECHRGSAKEDSKWREILSYFNNATHVGLTATPKETDKVSNIEYFGDPIYTYSLRKGIDDGFLAPYKVVKVALNIDNEWNPPAGFRDKQGELLENRTYNVKDFDRNIIVDERRELVAKKVSEFLKGYDRFAKTIIFCVDIEHAEGMRRALINENVDLVTENSKYIMRITGDNDEGKRELDNFINPNEKYPVIATTSKLMSTGVDAQTCKLIVLDSNINSMTEFKQMIGRGTRINEDYGKHYFTIMDFRNVTSLFSDPEFDGEPVLVKSIGENDSISQIEDDSLEEYYDRDLEFNDPVNIIEAGEVVMKKRKIRVDGVEVSIINERVQYLGLDGKIVTQSLKDYTKINVMQSYHSLDDFLQRWNSTDKKRVIVDELEDQGIFFDVLKEQVGKDFDPFDLICHVAFDSKPLTRKERSDNVKKRNYFAKYGEQAQKVINSLLDKYTDDGLLTIESTEVLRLDPLNKLGTPVELVQAFGGKLQYIQALKEIETQLYQAA